MSVKAPCKYLESTWVLEMTNALSRLHPEMARDEIEKFVAEQYVERYQNHEAILYNSYENTVVHTSLGEVVDWAEAEKPLIAESGVFFYPRNVKRNVNTEIIQEAMLDARTVHKAEKFAAMEAGDSFTAAVKDIQQNNDKKAANSGYGAEGQASSFLFNVHSAMSVTACGRAQLSTAINCFENLFGDNVRFFNMDEFHCYIQHIVDEAKEWKFGTFDVINFVPSKKEWIHRFEAKFLHHSLYDHDQIRRVCESLDDELRARTYYKANLREFLWRNRCPSDLYENIMGTDDEFIDPNKVPPAMTDDMNKLSAMVVEFVNYRYSWFRYEDRARYQKRRVVIVFDTDSCFLYLNPIAQFVIQKVLPMKLYRRKRDREAHKLKAINTLACITSEAIATTLWNYLGYVNVAEKDRPLVKMKNEFYYSRVIATFAKKSYIALMMRQEKVLFKEPRLDVKGVNFFKSTASEKTTEFIYQDILMDQLLQPKDGVISLRRTYRKIYDFQQRIAEEIQHGEMGFLKRSIRVKSADAYSVPMRIGQYKAVFVWNYVNEDKDRIELPATTTLVKVILRSKKDVAALAPWPRIYEKMMELFDTNPDVGDYTIMKDGKERRVKGKGIKSIALPGDYDEVPDWVLAIIDTTTLVNDNMALFTQLYRPLGLVPGTTTHNRSQLKYYTNIVRI